MKLLITAAICLAAISGGCQSGPQQKKALSQVDELTAKYNLDKIKFVGYAFQIEMKYRAFVKNFKIVEVPIIFTDRTKGQSKMSGGIIREAVVGVIMLRLRKIFNRL